jgi:hypothetical protein
MCRFQPVGGDGLVTKSRIVQHLGNPCTINGVVYLPRQAMYQVDESMSDSSLTGSARTDVDAVDAFLNSPTSKHDFHRALQVSSKTAGDAGIASFRVDRTKRVWTSGQVDVTLVGDTGTVTQLGGAFPQDVTTLTQFPSVATRAVPNAGQLNVMGQELYSAALPNRAQAELSSMLAEVVASPARALDFPAAAVAERASRYRREVQDIPDTRSILRVRKATAERIKSVKGLPLADARAAADDYLAYIFGARPTVQSLDQLAESITRSRLMAETIVRSQDRRIRRRRQRPPWQADATKYVTNRVGLGYPAGSGSFAMRDASLQYFTHFQQDVWWAGAFRYHASDTEQWIKSTTDLMLYVDRVTGLGGDIRTLWDVVPFSFIADWFANTGDFLENRQILADYNIACEYGYIMTHTHTTRDLVVNGTISRDSTNPTTVARYGTAKAAWAYTRLDETKQRAACGSYGFYTKPLGFNAYQWGALAALGLSMQPGVPPRLRG